jgi:phosphatidylinositol transfer protein SFH5
MSDTQINHQSSSEPQAEVIAPEEEVTTGPTETQNQSSQPLEPSSLEKPVEEVTKEKHSQISPSTTTNQETSEKTEAEVISDSSTSSSKQEKLNHLFDSIPNLIESSHHSEMWGVKLVSDRSDVPTSIVLHKFLIANSWDLEAAKGQLEKALKWRKEVEPLELLKQAHDREKFDGLGYVTVFEEGDEKEVISWNIYGGVKDLKATFSDVKESVEGLFLSPRMSFENFW